MSDRCPHCGHARTAHVRGKGCDVGWRYADDGRATTTGCICTSTFPPRIPVNTLGTFTPDATQPVPL